MCVNLFYMLWMFSLVFILYNSYSCVRVLNLDLPPFHSTSLSMLIVNAMNETVAVHANDSVRQMVQTKLLLF